MIMASDTLLFPETNGYYPLPPGKLATLTIYYEQFEPFPSSPAEKEGDLSFRRLTTADLDLYRDLFRAVGTRYLWVSRLFIDNAALAAILSDEAVEAYAAMRDGRSIGLVELDFSTEGEAEIVYFGLRDGETGLGRGRSLMSHVFACATARGTKRLWLHTCHFDAVHARRFYEKQGFKAYRLAVELLDDPRLTGELPRETAPEIPLVSP
jgi:GNAT superfamily N-acetyltransferase